MSSNYRRLSQSYASTRVSLRWLPEPPFENTETLVLTVGEWYVDLRVDKGSGALDWAIAGECTVKDVNPRMYRLLLFRLSYSVCLINCFDRAHCLHTHNWLAWQLQCERPMSLHTPSQRIWLGDWRDAPPWFTGESSYRVRGIMEISFEGWDWHGRSRESHCVDPGIRGRLPEPPFAARIQNFPGSYRGKVLGFTTDTASGNGSDERLREKAEDCRWWSECQIRRVRWWSLESEVRSGTQPFWSSVNHLWLWRPWSAFMGVPGEEG